MIYSTLLVAFSAMASIVGAQTDFTTCCNVSPATVDAPTRASWCRAQMNTCPEVCSNGQVSNNTCDSNTLTFSCTCLTGNTPNISDYGQTLPSLECDNWVSQCVTAHPNDLAGQDFCHSFICGKKNATALIASGNGPAGSSASGSAASTASSTATASGSAAATTSKSAARAMLSVANNYGTGAVAFGLLALFGLAL